MSFRDLLTRHKKASRFARGLSEPLRSMLTTHIHVGATYEALVEMALSNTLAKSEEPKDESKVGSSGKKLGDSKKKGSSSSASAALAVQQGQIAKETRCYRCGVKGHYPKQCKGPYLKGKCYICAQSGHLARDCPRKAAQGPASD